MTLPAERPLLSIVIPTKNRYDTLLSSVEAMLVNISDPRLEIVIEDNSDDPTPAYRFLEDFLDPRIRYTHHHELRSIVENTEQALNRATGEYITFIGDDDFVVPDIVECVQQFADRGIEAVSYPPAYYWWDTIRFKIPSRFHQPCAFWYPSSATSQHFLIDTEDELERVLAQGAVGLFRLPRIYHGIVHHTVLAKIKAKAGRFVNGASPDMALALGAAHVIQSHVWFGRPLTVYGASKNSGGGWTASQTHYGTIADQAHLPQSTKDNWSKDLPPIWSEHTIYPQTAMEVLVAFKKNNTIDFATFFASMIVNEPYLRKHVLPFAWRYLKHQPNQILPFLFAIAKKSLGLLLRNLRLKVTGLPFELGFYATPDACIKQMVETQKLSR